jgi:hypothetical protein
MPDQSSRPIPSIDVLRALAESQGVHPTDADLEAVHGFLAAILPALTALEAELPADVAPAGLFLPDAAG